MSPPTNDNTDEVAEDELTPVANRKSPAFPSTLSPLAISIEPEEPPDEPLDNSIVPLTPKADDDVSIETLPEDSTPSEPPLDSMIEPPAPPTDALAPVPRDLIPAPADSNTLPPCTPAPACTDTSPPIADEPPTPVLSINDPDGPDDAAPDDITTPPLPALVAS